MITTIWLFIKKGCPNCERMHQRLEEKAKQAGYAIRILDIESEEGLAEAVFYDIKTVPAILVDMKEGVSWLFRTPEEIEESMKML